MRNDVRKGEVVLLPIPFFLIYTYYVASAFLFSRNDDAHIASPSLPLPHDPFQDESKRLFTWPILQSIIFPVCLSFQLQWWRPYCQCIVAFVTRPFPRRIKRWFTSQILLSRSASSFASMEVRFISTPVPRWVEMIDNRHLTDIWYLRMS